ncbi:MAG: DUF427 domain-containing protein [Haliea sp.]|nr:MAG: DUF427 domain-containing protein [Haliea sp.]
MTTSTPPPPPWLRAARDHWSWRGQARPVFAATPGPHQTSVWDFPRPPHLAPESREVRIVWDGVQVACSKRTLRVLETAHPPTYYIPWEDVARELLQPAPGGSFCEWKGPARYWSLVHGGLHLPSHAWSYPQPLAGAEALADCVAFYARGLTCSVGGLAATPQPGGFYGGWVTSDLSGPFKGEPGSESW